MFVHSDILLTISWTDGGSREQCEKNLTVACQLKTRGAGCRSLKSCDGASKAYEARDVFLPFLSGSWS